MHVVFLHGFFSIIYYLFSKHNYLFLKKSNSGDLVNIYKKYAENNGWKVIPIEETRGTDGGYKTCVVQINGDFVYSKVISISISIFPHTHLLKRNNIFNII